MKVFIAGATGAIGRPLLAELRLRGHEVAGLSRSDANDRTIRERGGTPVRADLFDAAPLSRAMRGCDAVVRVATRIPGNGHERDAWKENDRIRREGTRALLEAAREAGVERYLQESVVWLARPDDGSPFDERSPARPDAITQSVLDAETMAARAPLASATLRLGWLYGPDTANMRAFAALLRARRSPILGDGSAKLSFLHVDDAASAFADALERRVTGVHHVVDDEPAGMGDFFDELARVLGVPRPLRFPRRVEARGTDGYVARLLTTPMVTSHAAFTRASGWKPRHPTYREGLAGIQDALGA